MGRVFHPLVYVNAACHMHYSVRGGGRTNKGACLLIPMMVEDDGVGHKRWVIYNTVTGAIDLGLQFKDMPEANLYAVEDPSFRLAIMGSEMGVA